MEILCGSGLAVGSTVKRKRSRLSRKPRANLDAMFQSYFCLPSYVEPYGKPDENENQRDTMVASDGSGAENKLKKLKLKLGGVTHTIHTKGKRANCQKWNSNLRNLRLHRDVKSNQRRRLRRLRLRLSEIYLVKTLIGRRKEKMKKQQEFVQEKSSNCFNLGSNTVRWTMGPSGTVVTFSEYIGLPNILQMVPRRYPPPREKCAGPNCTNVYKYGDSKSKLPLCSLNCYRAIHEKIHPLIAC